MIKAGIIFIWTGTNASIPAGWSRVTAMDSYYPKGTAASTDPNTTGGASTHSHTSPSHSHTLNDHTHTITVAAGSGGGLTTGSGSNTAVVGHTHSNFTSGSLNNGSTSSEAATYGSCSNDPPYYEVIYITPSSDISGFNIPTGIVCLADAAAPTGFYACDGNNGTPNLVGKYLKGAAASGNAGGTGGSTTNIHSLSHVHTTSHGHASATSGNQSDSSCDSRATASSPPTQLTPHTHAIALPAATPSTTDNVSLTTSETVEPAYYSLMAIYNSSAATLPVNAIAMWLGTLATIPDGWALVSAMNDKHLKITATVGSIGATGGSNTHTHASQNHNHSVSHSHSTSVSHGGSRGVQNSGKTCTTSSTTHAISTNSINLVTADAATTANSSSNEPSYRTIAFIKLITVSAIETMNGLVRASVESVNGQALATIETDCGLA